MASRGLPTWHSGVQFRSRLEARWAVFFDQLDLKWIYELQGYKTDGDCYLPDLLVYAPLGNLHVEIKPHLDSDADGVRRWRAWADQRPDREKGSRAALLVGQPPGDLIIVIGGNDDDPDPVKGGWEDDRQEWRPCPDGRHFDLAWPGLFKAKFAEDGCPDKFGGLGEDRLADAITAARSARFDGRGSGETA